MVSGGKERSGTVSQPDALWPSTGEWCRAVGCVAAIAVIVGGTLIRRSSRFLEVTDIPGRQIRVRVRVRVRGVMGGEYFHEHISN